jgi:hypothetical protein
MFPLLTTKDSLASPEELAQFKVFLAPALWSPFNIEQICMYDGVTFTNITLEPFDVQKYLFWLRQKVD